MDREKSELSKSGLKAGNEVVIRSSRRRRMRLTDRIGMYLKQNCNIVQKREVKWG